MSRLVFVRNTVVRGFGRGSKELGCPTANVDGANSIDLSTGIYCGFAQLIINDPSQVQAEPGKEDVYQETLKKLPYTSSVRPMVASFGYNPQYGNKDRSFEVHILDNFDYNFYGAELRVLICKKLRNEEKYDSLEELKKAIANDIKNAKHEVTNFEEHTANRDYFLQFNSLVMNQNGKS